MTEKIELSELAINGGPKIRIEPWPGRGHIGIEEKTAVDALFDKAIDTGGMITYAGPKEEGYCKAFTKLMGGGYADAVSSGTAANYIALKALDPEPFTEIIVSPITDPGGMMPIVMLGCIPVIADAAPGCYNTGPEQIEPLISPLTSAILVAHIGGEPVNIEGIMALAKKHGIPVVEDCAQAHLAMLNGKYVGTFGDIAAFSTMHGKHYCTGGTGGVVYTKNEELYWGALRIADRGKPFGLPEGSSNSIASLNFNLDEIGAAIGIEQLKKLPDIVRRRQEVVDAISEGIKEKGIQAVSLPPQLPGARASWWFLRTRFHAEKVTCDKAAFCEALNAEGIGARASYRHLPHESDWYKNRKVFGASGLP